MRLGQEFLRFAVVGVVGLGVDLAVLYASAWLLGWYAARVLSFTAAASATWWLNRRYTFQAAADDTSVWTQYSRYMVSMLGGAALNYAAYAAVLRWSELPGKAALGVAAGSLAGMTANYLSARYLVFKRPS